MGLPTTYYQQLLWHFILKHQNYCARDEYVYVPKPHCPTKYWHFKEVGYQEIIPREALLALAIMVVRTCHC